jgi:hypothetical protein
MKVKNPCRVMNGVIAMERVVMNKRVQSSSAEIASRAPLLVPTGDPSIFPPISDFSNSRGVLSGQQRVSIFDCSSILHLDY